MFSFAFSKDPVRFAGKALRSEIEVYVFVNDVGASVLNVQIGSQI